MEVVRNLLEPLPLLRCQSSSVEAEQDFEDLAVVTATATGPRVACSEQRACAGSSEAGCHRALQEPATAHAGAGVVVYQAVERLVLVMGIAGHNALLWDTPAHAIGA